MASQYEGKSTQELDSMLTKLNGDWKRLNHVSNNWMSEESRWAKESEINRQQKEIRAVLDKRPDYKKMMRERKKHYDAKRKAKYGGKGKTGGNKGK